VRTDHGGENVEVQRLMVQARGRTGAIAGRSVHNTRIERLWLDVGNNVGCTFSRLFHSMETEGVLDVEDERQMWALHFVFLPR
jgi:hypothetical protein